MSRTPGGGGWVAFTLLSLRDHRYMFSFDGGEPRAVPALLPTICGEHIVPKAELAACAALNDRGVSRACPPVSAPHASANGRCPPLAAASVTATLSGLAANLGLLRDIHMDLLGTIRVIARVRPLGPLAGAGSGAS